MRFSLAPGLNVIAPGLLQQEWCEAEVFGAATWLWMQARTRRDTPVKWLSTLLLPPIIHQQFLLAMEDNRPVVFLSWANFSQAAEKAYLTRSHSRMTSDDWASGDRCWVIDWIAPFGHTAAVWRLLQRQLFATRCIRYLYHRGIERGFRIKTFRGSALHRLAADAWFAARPVVLDPICERFPICSPCQQEG